ncbi:MAG: ATP-dependent DNA helicase RecG [Treponemataceae bacterium]|nr:ATP-dependent DNA helicase RecG [Treponemataceae bacterium]
MKLKEFENPIETLSGIGPSLANSFSKVNVFKICDLLSYYPKSYEDRTKKIPLKDFAQNGKIHTIVQITGHEWFGYGRMRTLKLIISDGITQACLACFNRPFMEKTAPIGSIAAVTAKFNYQYGQIQASAFDLEIIAKEGNLQDYQNSADPTARMLPIYPLTSGLTQNQVRKAVGTALKKYGMAIDDELPQSVIENQKLLNKKEAIRAIHQGETASQIDQAIKTIKFEELYFFQKNILMQARERKNCSECSHEFTDLSPRQKKLLSSLTFELTEDQTKIIAQLNCEIESSEKTNAVKLQNPSVLKPYTISRLVQGDVGSGKTLVAFFAALRIIDWGGQVCLLAPTELLARQHAENASRILKDCDVNVSFLTGNINAKGRNALLSSIKSGQTQLIVGTHALFSRNVQYSNLQLAIIDEQHRFGVVQRNAIKEKCCIPNILMMSATPIPQTLAQTVFNDLDLSTIKSMPKGRLPIKTHLTKPGNENIVYESVRKELAAGHQAYFVYPMIENNDDDAEEGQLFDTKKIKNASDMFNFLSKEVYPEYTCALIHSKIDEEEESRILEEFRQNKIQIIVATTVVEVGVDVPNASCMVIEQAERFGLAALHQLRGRVGRSQIQSHCFLIYGSKLTDIAKERLKAMYSTCDGFEIAELDLKLRGPGEVSGIQQSGFLSLGLSDPINDGALMQLAREEALKNLE